MREISIYKFSDNSVALILNHLHQVLQINKLLGYCPSVKNWYLKIQSSTLLAMKNVLKMNPMYSLLTVVCFMLFWRFKRRGWFLVLP